MIPQIKIEDYNYPLTDDRIAKYPLPRRDSSKLLIYKDGRCRDRIFRNISLYLPQGALMVFNNTKVVPARLFFRRESGAHVEIFCLEPVEPAEYVSSFASTGKCSWKCLIGNAKRWKDDVLHYDSTGAVPSVAEKLEKIALEARLLSREDRDGVVEFSWNGDVPFSEVLDLCGRIPIPPYLNRDTEEIDYERYQTLYAHIRGSVAAPTAGLHFTDRVLSAIDRKGIERETVCLHVGAGTFLPVKSSEVSEHPMHREPFTVSVELLRKLRYRDRKVVAVGTTSVRTLESLFYVGVSCIENGEPRDVEQWEPYTRQYAYTTEEALDAIIDYLNANGLKELEIGTRIIIVPGFRFRIVDAMVTNFHQPQSTLILLVSAFVGGDWKTIYKHALSMGYRFLSYGDSSLLFRREDIEYDSIRPYSEDEARAAFKRISRSPALASISKYLFPQYPANTLAKSIRDVRNIDEFQNRIMVGVISVILAKTSEGFTVSGVENLKNINGRFLAISNHRDIVLDPALIQYTMHEAGLPSTRICAGDNLLSSKLVEDLMRSNRMITVIRGISARELYLSSLRLSRFIRNSITSGDSSVWIAQKEGRTKNGLDHTEQGLLKMFDLSGRGSFTDNFEELSLVPLSISYEYESCDIRKARELFISKNKKYVKKPNEDLHSILTGITQAKGHIHLTIGEPLTHNEIEAASAFRGNERYQQLMKILDERIIKGYKLWKTNYMGYDLMTGGCRFLGVKYLQEDLDEFLNYTNHKLSKLEFGLDKEGVRKIFYEIYGNPVAAVENL